MQDQKERVDTGNVLQMICQTKAKGEVISETELGNLFCLLVAVGNDSLHYTLSAVIYALVVNPELLKMLHNSDARFDASIKVNLQRHPNSHMTPVLQFRWGIKRLLVRIIRHQRRVILVDQIHFLSNAGGIQ